jgi:hypothetical protein
LGSSDRWREILAANRDLVTDPELLPVGKTLRIPAAQSAPIDRNSAAAPPPPAAEAEVPPLTTLVPIP